MSDLTLRPAVDNDHEGLVNLIACAYGEEADCVFDAEYDFAFLQAAETFYREGGGNVLVAESRLGIVGMIGWLPAKIETHKSDFGLSCGLLVHTLFVHPLERRRRLAMDMMFAAIDAAEAAEAETITVWMNTKFHRGHKFLRFFTFEAETETRVGRDMQKSTERRYTLDVDDFLDALEDDTEFYESFFSPPETPIEEDIHADIDDPSQFVEDNSEPWR